MIVMEKHGGREGVHRDDEDTVAQKTLFQPVLMTGQLLTTSSLAVYTAYQLSRPSTPTPTAPHHWHSPGGAQLLPAGHDAEERQWDTTVDSWCTLGECQRAACGPRRWGKPDSGAEDHQDDGWEQRVRRWPSQSSAHEDMSDDGEFIRQWKPVASSQPEDLDGRRIRRMLDATVEECQDIEMRKKGWIGIGACRIECGTVETPTDSTRLGLVQGTQGGGNVGESRTGVRAAGSASVVTTHGAVPVQRNGPVALGRADLTTTITREIQRESAQQLS
ncbi:hypothetical protein F5I97DRAFT_2074403 [Phlebopus sp. FC_14]|nr:hypothetical protein F5I97DRAFT_2074403 [Phlebopus sp. FC_14]